MEIKRIANEKISSFPRLINNQPPSIGYYNVKMKLKCNGDILK